MRAIFFRGGIIINTLQKFYLINQDTVLITGEYDAFGNKCARVLVGDMSFLTDRSTPQLINDTLLYVGYDYRGAVNGSKSILGKQSIYMCPIIVNPYLSICIFPEKSPKRIDCIWFNLDHITRTLPADNQTLVELSNGHSILVDSTIKAFHDKMQRAEQLKRITQERGYSRTPTVSHSETKKHKIAKLKNGKYNFEALEDWKKCV